MQDASFNTLLLIKEKFDGISAYLNERAMRIWCATEVNNYNKIFGSGGVTVVHRATGVSRPTIYSGMQELPDLLKNLDVLVEPFSRGDPESPLRWTSKSVRNGRNRHPEYLTH